jgi:hypothetical protein
MSSQKSLVLFLVITLFHILGCASDPGASSVGKGAKQFEGWAGPPEDASKKPFDYFYMKYSARASEKAVNKKSGAMMQSTCTDAATTMAKGDLVGKLVGESLTGASGVSDGESTGKVVVREFAAKVKGVNTKECAARGIAKPEIPGSEWLECECVMYVKIDGGKDSVIASAKEAENK